MLISWLANGSQRLCCPRSSDRGLGDSQERLWAVPPVERGDRGTASADLRWGAIAKARVGASLVVLPPVLFDQDPRLLRGVKPLAIEALIAQPAVEALAHPALPGRARGDECGDDADLGQPLAHPPRDELGAV